MKITAPFKTLNDNLPKGAKAPARTVALEVYEGENIKRFIISYSEWLEIKEWFTSKSDLHDYYLMQDEPDMPVSIKRLDKKISEIQACKLTTKTVFLRNLSNILFARLPLWARFIIPLCIAAVIWLVNIANNLAADISVDKSVLMLTWRLSSVVFSIFFAVDILFLIARLLKAAADKYDAFINKSEARFSGSFILNFLLLGVFVLVNPEALFKIFKTVLHLIGIFTS